MPLIEVEASEEKDQPSSREEIMKRLEKRKKASEKITKSIAEVQGQRLKICENLRIFHFKTLC